MSNAPAWKAINKGRDKRRKQAQPKTPPVVSLTPALEKNVDRRGKVGNQIAKSPADEQERELARLTGEQQDDWEASPLDDKGDNPRLPRHRKL